MRIGQLMDRVFRLLPKLIVPIIPISIAMSALATLSAYLNTEEQFTGFRPIVLSLCAQAKHETLSIYFSILSAFRTVSENFVKNLASIADFPPGTYPPPLLHCR